MKHEDVRQVVDVLAGAGLLSCTAESAVELVVSASGKKTLAQRRNDFWSAICSEHGFPEELPAEFFEYWSECGARSVKMRFEKEKSWELRKRMMRFWYNKVTSFGRNPERWGVNGPAQPELVQSRKIDGVLSVNARRPWNQG